MRKNRAAAEARRRIVAACVAAVRRAIVREVTARVELMREIDKRYDRHAAAVARAFVEVWREECRIVVANVRQMKAMRQKAGPDIADSLLWPRRKFEKKLTSIASKPLMRALVAAAKEAGERYAFGVDFNMRSPGVEAYLQRYIPKTIKGVEGVSRDEIGKILKREILAGSGPDKIARAIREKFSTWERSRARTIARTESIKATNRGAQEMYRQSGVVEKKEWMTNFIGEGACPACEELDAAIVDLDDVFESEGMEADGPPLHPNCRCAILPVIEETT